MCPPKTPKIQEMFFGEKRELPKEPPKPLEVKARSTEKERGNPLRIDLAAVKTRGASGAQV